MVPDVRCPSHVCAAAETRTAFRCDVTRLIYFGVSMATVSLVAGGWQSNGTNVQVRVLNETTGPQLEIVQISPTAGDYQRVCLSLSLAFRLSLTLAVCISLSLIVCLRVRQSVCNWVRSLSLALISLAHRGRDSSVGTASEWKHRYRRNIAAGSSPRCGKRFFSQCQPIVQTLLITLSA